MAVDPQLGTKIQYVNGVGPKTAIPLSKPGLQPAEDLLWYLPFRYEDRSEIPPIMHLRPGRHNTALGKLTEVRTRPLRGGKVLLEATLSDRTGELVIQWFNQPWLGRQLEPLRGTEIVAYGLVREGYRSRLEMAATEWEAIEDGDTEEFARIVPVYPLTEGVSQRVVRRAARAVAEGLALQVSDPLPKWVRQRERLPELGPSLRQLHLPDSEEQRILARQRLAFEEFLYLQIALQLRRREVKQEVGISFPISRFGELEQPVTTLFGQDQETPAASFWQEVLQMLPFQPTRAQERVVHEVWADMERPAPMNRLVQGDVGSGKTAVAACAMLAAVRCGYQAALMAPTEILAEQHAFNIKRLFEPKGIGVVLLAGKLGAKEKRRATTQAANGEAQVCVGTHALIQEGIQFANLGLAVIDEQHRFGVLQRMALRNKGRTPDVLVMTATPIPRTVTMTMYGDLDLSVIDELPPGRKPIKTHWKRPGERAQTYEVVRRLVAEGRQAYFVCPMIVENEKMQAQAAQDLHLRLSQQVFPDLRVGLIHGQLKTVEKEQVMEDFRAHKLDILVATVVIEVGVDVPNASIMVIEDANRFGLAQLHQLRGRVGRGSTQSYCVLIAEAKSEESRRRLEILVETSDGFRIAEEDLKIRGPGDIMGTQQHGSLDLRIADLIEDAHLLERARQAAIDLLERDPELNDPDNREVLKRVRQRRSDEALITVS